MLRDSLTLPFMIKKLEPCVLQLACYRILCNKMLDHGCQPYMLLSNACYSHHNILINPLNGCYRLLLGGRGVLEFSPLPFGNGAGCLILETALPAFD